MFRDDVVLNVAREFRILKKQQVRVEDVSMTAAKLLLRAIFNGLELPARKPHSSPKASTLAFEICVRDVRAINIACAFLKPQHATDHDPIRNRQTFRAQLVRRANKPLAVNFLSLVKVAREQTNNRVERFLLVDTLRHNS